MAANAEIFFEHDRWGRNLAWSAGLHVAIAGCIIISGMIIAGNHGSTWGTGGGGDAMGVSLVSAVPLPSNSQSQNVLANESKGLTQSLAKPEEKEPDAIPIPGKNAKLKPKPRTSESQKAQPQEEASNVVPFREGGPVSGPYGSFSAGGAKGGFGFTGGGGDFGSRYAFYVQQVRNKVSENWLKYEVDPRINEAQRVYVTFDITRDGRPTNV
jgi:protein TonB